MNETNTNLKYRITKIAGNIKTTVDIMTTKNTTTDLKEALKKEIERLTAEIRDLTDQVGKRDRIVRNEQEVVRRHRSMLDSQQKKIDELKKENQRLYNQVDLLMASIEELRKKNEKLRDLITQMNVNSLKSVSAPPATAPGILRQAAEVIDQRGTQRDQPGGERSMNLAVRLFNLRSGLNLTERQGWQFMQALKQARDAGGDFVLDDLLDLAAYVALEAECALDDQDKEEGKVASSTPNEPNAVHAIVGKPLPEGLPPLPEGYVYLGKGNEFKELLDRKVFKGRSLINPACWSQEDKALIGNNDSWHYAAPADSEIVKLNTKGDPAK